MKTGEYPPDVYPERFSSPGERKGGGGRKQTCRFQDVTRRK